MSMTLFHYTFNMFLMMMRGIIFVQPWRRMDKITLKNTYYVHLVSLSNGSMYKPFYIIKINYAFAAYDVNYFNLRINDDVNKKIRPAGHDSVQWTIQISAIQNTSLKW